MHRGNFQQLLLRHIRDEIGETSIRLSQKLVVFRSVSDHVEVDFVNPSTGGQNTELAKVLVGADGINSTVRKILYPDEGRPLWSGVTIWRGVTQTDKLLLGGRTLIVMGNPNDVQLVMGHVSKNVINWTCLVRVEDSNMQISPVTPDWNNLGHIEDLLPLISNMKLNFVDIHHIIQSSMIINKFPMTDRNILPRWTHDRVTLLGDAAHPMYPYGGNGASQAILDARGLILSFRQHGVTPQGLQAFDDLRRPASNIVVLASRQYSCDEILKVVHERAPDGFEHLSDVISSAELEAIMSNSKRVAGLHAEQLNQEPPLF
ncbi:unnamed protein product [Rotaria sp. Silwood1]|nr:unnamed protein product [Rotaria sp. Silwood1]